MKRIIFGLMLAMMFCTLVQGANRTVTENDGQGNKKRVIELRDTVINGETVTDTLSVMTYENGAGSSNAPEKWRTHHSSGMDWNGFDLGSKTSETVIAVTAIVFVFGLPLLIIFVVFFFRYKNRKAKYRLAEQALASGQQLPENFFKEAAATDIRSKGINNIFVGIGLFIFLWAITGEFGLGCIGLLVMFTGFGQLVIFYSQPEGNRRFGYVPSGRSMQHTAAGRGTAHGHLPCPGHTEGNGTHLHHALLHGRPKHRKDCRYHRMSGGNGKKPPLAGERQNGFLLKTKWL